MFKKVKAKRLKDGWQKMKVDHRDIRDYDFSIDVSKAEKGLLHLVDIPFALNTLNKAVELYLKKEHIEKDIRERLLEYLIADNSLAKGIMSAEVVDI